MSAQQKATLKRVVKRVLRPVLSPIDGRVADINRRIESVRVSSTEASSYIGVELRRLDEGLAELRDEQAAVQGIVANAGERSLEEYYRMRLAQVADLPLEKLDPSLAHAINDATGHRGFYAQAGLWFNPPVAVALSEATAPRDARQRTDR